MSLDSSISVVLSPVLGLFFMLVLASFSDLPSTEDLENPRSDLATAILFSDGTQAYLRRDYAKALGCFEECLTLRPMDKRVAHNIERLRERVS